MTNSVLMFSGGLDSACAYHILGKPKCLGCMGTKGPAGAAGLGELKAVRQFMDLDDVFYERITVIDFDWTPFQRKGKHQFPRENILSQVAWGHGHNLAMFAWVKNDNVNYNRIRHMMKVTKNSVDMPGFSTAFPVWKHYKHQLVAHALVKGAPPEFLRASWSCLSRGDIHCGRCTNCVERYLAMRFNQVEDVEYLEDPQGTEKMAELIEKFEGNREWSLQLSA